MDNPSSSSAVRSVGLTGVQMMMRQLASVTDNYGHADGTWNLWPETMAGSSLVPSTSSVPDNAAAAGLRFRGTVGTTRNGSLSEVLTMVDRVREVLPHIPDELIIEVHVLSPSLPIAVILVNSHALILLTVGFDEDKQHKCYCE